MKRFFTLLVSAFLFTMVMGQPTALIKKATIAPVIDGLVDDVWSEAEKNVIDIPFSVLGIAETPTVGNSWWKMLWNEDGLYILVFVDDDVFVPAYKSNPVSTQSWFYDKPEIYFDCNSEKKDGAGPGTAAIAPATSTGHYQVAPTEIEAIVNGGTSTTETRGEVWAFNATDAPHYYVEYFVPFTMLKDKDGGTVDVTAPIGFDVSILDNDILAESRNRMNWANAGAINENYSNMDDAGLINLDGAEPPTPIDAITITDGAITTDNGTFQINPVILPANATLKQLIYSVTPGSTGRASVSAKGLVTGIKDGTVGIRAAAADGSMTESNEATITISGQTTTHFEASYIMDGNFTLGTATTQSSFWIGGAAIENGVMTITNPTVKTPDLAVPWDYAITQMVNIPQEMKDMPFVLQFKAWADEARTFDVDFEHGSPGNSRFGNTPDPRAQGGRSQWRLDLTTEPQIFTLEITDFSRMEPLPMEQRFNLFAGLATAKVYVDSLFLVTKEDYILAVKELSKSSMRVYPNPVDAANQLNVNTGSVNAKVAIYNSLGQKMMEKVATGNIATFNVSSLRKGLYFVKLSDGTTQKFIK